DHAANDAGGPVLAAGEDPVPVRAERCARERAGVSLEIHDELPGYGVPEPARELARRHDPPSVRAERRGANEEEMPAQDVHETTAADVPDAGVVVGARGDEQARVGRELGVRDE